MNIKKVIQHLFLLIVLVGGGLATLSLTAIGQEKSDAIAVRIVPNPDRLSIGSWYTQQQINGSPQSTVVDGYDAIRDGRTVYIAAPNISSLSITGSGVNGIVYSNIYIITYSQNATQITDDIFGKILSKWKFNTNLDSALTAAGMSSSGFCLSDLSQGALINASCAIDSDCGDGFSCQDSLCRPKNSCRLDGDCALGQVCSSVKSSLIRDLKRYESLLTIKSSLDDYQKLNGRYPILSSGTYLPRVALSVWPSWQTVFTGTLGISGLNDPINKLGECSGYDTATCWSDKNKSFYNNGTADNLTLPNNSYLIAYKAAANGSSYDLCSNMETDFKVNEKNTVVALNEYNCQQNTNGLAKNKAPNLVSPALVAGKVGQDLQGFVLASDPEGDNINFSLSNFSGTSWCSQVVLKDTSDSRQKMVYLSANSNVSAGVCTATLTLTDSQSNKSSITLTISSQLVAPSVVASESDYKLDPTKPLDYDIYFTASSLVNVTLSFSQGLSLKNQALGAELSDSQLPGEEEESDGQTTSLIPSGCQTHNGSWTWSPANIGTSYDINHCLKAKLIQDAKGKYRINISGVIGDYNTSYGPYFNYILTVNSGSTASGKAKIKIDTNQPVLDIRCSRQGVLNRNYSCQVINVNQVPVADYSLDAGAPNDLAIDHITGLVSGVLRNIGTFPVNIKATDYYGGQSSVAYNLNVASECGQMMVQYAGGPWNSDGTLKNQGGYYRTVLIGDQCWLRDNLNIATWDRTGSGSSNLPICTIPSSETDDGHSATQWSVLSEAVAKDAYHLNGSSSGPDCVPSCDGKACGDDGCGGSCGSCDKDFQCVDGSCENTLEESATLWGNFKRSFVALADTVWFRNSLINDYHNNIGTCYGGLEAFCQAEGRLYSLAEVTADAIDTTVPTRGICPAGFHVPSDAEYKALETNLGLPESELDSTSDTRGGSSNMYQKLKNLGDSGFDALLTGAYISTTTTSTLQLTDHNLTYFWSSSFSSTDNPIVRFLQSAVQSIVRNTTGFNKTERLPLRCVMDTPCATVCDDGLVCASDGVCRPQCTPNCSGKVCGSDGCGGSCGLCSIDSQCSNGQCSSIETSVDCETGLSGDGTTVFDGAIRP